jgi:DNA-binding response OmpR family regulator
MIPSLTAKHRVLVIDDEPGMRSLMRRGLGLAGFEVQTAENGELGLELVQTYLPDLILLDLMMPGLDGFETLERLFVLEPCPKIIVLSGRDEPEDRARTVKANGFLVKPISFEGLLELINLNLNAEQNRTEQNRTRLARRVKRETKTSRVGIFTGLEGAQKDESCSSG